MDWHRRSIRLPDYDYSTPGAYFVTICAFRRQTLFRDESLRDIVQAQWFALPIRFPEVRLDQFVIMPNHIHFVLWLTGLTDANPAVGASLADAPGGAKADNVATDPEGGTIDDGGGSRRSRASPAPTLGNVVGAFKSQVAVEWLRWIKDNRPTESGRLWQRNYYERVVRDEDELNRIREYVQTNPLKWEFDHDNLQRTDDEEWNREWSWLELGEDHHA